VTLLAAGGFWWRPSWLALAALLLSYVSALVGSALVLSEGSLRQLVGVALACACMHVGYGLGFGRGLIDFTFFGQAPRASATRLTR